MPLLPDQVCSGTSSRDGRLSLVSSFGSFSSAALLAAAFFLERFFPEDFPSCLFLPPAVVSAGFCSWTDSSCDSCSAAAPRLFPTGPDSSRDSCSAAAPRLFPTGPDSSRDSCSAAAPRLFPTGPDSAWISGSAVWVPSTPAAPVTSGSLPFALQTIPSGVPSRAGDISYWNWTWFLGSTLRSTRSRTARSMGLGTNSVKPSCRNISLAPLMVLAVSAITGRSRYIPSFNSLRCFKVCTPSKPGIM